MPTAKLLYPRSLNTGGVLYHRGVVTPVDEETAQVLAEDDRFFVEGLDGHSSEEKIAALQEKSVSEKIREAADQLDPDVESNFTVDGRPSAEAISQALRKEVSQHTVDVALGLGGKGRVVIKELSNVVIEPTKKPRIKKVKLKPRNRDHIQAPAEVRPPVPAQPPVGAGADDPTTKGAIPLTA